jgi:hypothetical protein
LQEEQANSAVVAAFHAALVCSGYSKQNRGHEGEKAAVAGVDSSAQAFGGLLKRSRTGMLAGITDLSKLRGFEEAAETAPERICGQAIGF